MKVYVYGMTVWSTIHRLNGGYPEEDTYSEIAETHTIPGGEGANAALLLDHWGHEVVLDGCHTGDLTREALLRFFDQTRIDVSLMPHEGGFPGWRDIVLCAGSSRTVLGWFGRHFAEDRPHWTRPSQERVEWADCVILDPFFPKTSAELADMCAQAGREYVTIDSEWQSPIAQRARAIVVSKEFLDRHYPGQSPETLMERYAASCRGLVVFTQGGEPVLMRASGEAVRELPISAVNPLDTLAAGDAFRAGLVHGLLVGESASEAVRLAIATSASVCRRFPSIHPLPGLDEIRKLRDASGGAPGHPEAATPP